MNHTHIDFHKGTHGYPIKNADDMMKPCPLMPDGEWVKCVFEMYYDPTSSKVTYKTISVSDNYNTDATKTYIRCGANCILTPENDIVAAVTGSAGVYIIAEHPNSRLLECRMGFPYLNINYFNGTIDLQNSAAWRIMPENGVALDAYYTIRTTNIFTSGFNLASITEETKLATVDCYWYVELGQFQ